MSRGAARSRRERLAVGVAGYLLAALLRLIARTYRVSIVGGEHLEGLRTTGEPAVIAFWHDRLFFASPFLSRQLIGGGYPLTVLSSSSRDGDLGASVGARLGGRVVRGSSSRGGRDAVRALLRELAAGRGLFLVPDGPKGPARRAKPGVVGVARMARAPLVPLTWVADRSWRLGSWDRLEIPKPFARVAVAVGAPRVVPRTGGDEELSRQLAGFEASLAALEAAAAASLAAGAAAGQSASRSKTR